MDDETPTPIPEAISARVEDRSITPTLAITLDASPEAPARARAEITAWLRHTALDGTLLDDARLLVSELVTNSFRHARINPNQPLRLTGSVRATMLRIEIHDEGIGGTVARRTPRQHDGAGGFGLDLAAQLSSAWGIERDVHGTNVWFELLT